MPSRLSAIDEHDIFAIVRKLINYPTATVCKHHVAAILINLVESKGFPGDRLADLADSVCLDVDDERAIACLDQLLRKEES